jgi:hypothetical protein
MYTSLEDIISRHLDLTKQLDEAYGNSVIWFLDSPKAQLEFKMYLQALTEEISEFFEVKQLIPSIISKPEREAELISAGMDELVDTLNMATLLVIRSGYNLEDIMSSPLGIKFGKSIPVVGDAITETHYAGITGLLASVVRFHLAANMLKNRPWKRTHYILDRDRFRERLIDAYLCCVIGVVNEAIHLMQGPNFHDIPSSKQAEHRMSMLHDAVGTKYNKNLFRIKTQY